ncbi:MAG: DASS family sodium-coupled anion symporter [Candidatus Eisenbacteria bacterium]
MFASIRRRESLLLIGLLLSVLVALALPRLPREQRVMAAVFVLTVFYWVTEPMPIFVTAVIGAFLSALLLGPLARLVGTAPVDYAIFLSPFASPVVVLLFGGFVLAHVFSKNNLDLEFCQTILARLGSKPNRVLFGIMAITALMSMWMSNTATTAILMAAVLPLVRAMPKDANLARALLLAIPFSANIGGVATPIGTPPNAIAVGLLAEEGTHVSFLAWMLAGFPVMMILLVLAYFLLRAFFPTKREHFSIAIDERPRVANRSLIYATFFATVLLWVTDWLHGIPSALIALVPLAVFAAAGLVTRRLVRELSWDTLLLIGGGLSLGVGIKQTGLADTVVAACLPSGLHPLAGLALFSSLIAVVATFMSHTAASNILLPLALSVAGALPSRMAITVALCSSFGMALPISTPPNAIAYGSELIDARDMLRVGVLITVLGVVFTLAYEMLLFRLLPGLYAAH